MYKSTVSKFLSGMVILILALMIQSCKPESEVVSTGGEIPGGQTTTKTIISGVVITYLDGIPVEGATVVIEGLEEYVILVTDAQGKYTDTLDIANNMNLTIRTSKEGFYSDVTDVYVIAGAKHDVDIIELEQDNTGTVPSGDPVSIFISTISSPTIAVKESGSEETTRLVFVVQDSAGVPIDLDHSVNVNFFLAAGPGGGEFLSPNSVQTNNNGQAAVNLTSGTKAGTVQIIAEITVDGKIIRSFPVRIAIHGGLPDQTHFSIAPAQINFAGYNIFGLTDEITAYVGDKYANPVRPETAVYFTSTGGIIEGSTLTNDQGIGSVDLISAQPQPYHEIWGPGFATITASSIDEDSRTIYDSILVLFSGIPQITDVSPTSFTLANGGSQNFVYTVSDQFGNPLAPGTSITVTVKGENMDVGGDVSIQLPDTQSKAWTHFSFSVFDKEADEVKPTGVTLTIRVDGPNGKSTVTIYGSGS
jgi:hypothetical protein